MSKRPPRPSIGPTSRNLMLKPGYRTNFSQSAYHSSSPSPASTRPSITDDEEEKPVPPYPFVSKFIFTEDEIKNSPSFQTHQISNDDELVLRRAGTCFIKELANRINAKIYKKSKQISPRVSSMAMIYFHRCFMFHSFATFLPLEMATTCLFLACKCENCPKHIAEFGKYYYQIANCDDEELDERETEIVVDMIKDYEICLLQTLAFEFEIVLPQVVVIDTEFYSENNSLKKLAFRFCADILTYTTLCLQYDENVLAAVAYFVAGAYLDIDMEKEYGENWLRLLAPTLTETTLTKIAFVFLDALKEMYIIIHSKKFELEDGEVL